MTKITELKPYIEARSKQDEILENEHEQKVLGQVGLALKVARKDPRDLQVQVHDIALTAFELERLTARLYTSDTDPEHRVKMLNLLIRISALSVAILIRRLVETYRR